MSRITNVITTDFRANGSQAIVTMGSISGGFRKIGQSINETTRMSERFGQQWKAVSTTVRYALAGGIVFGLRGVVDQMKQIQVQMGLISAIGSVQGGSGLIVGKNLTDLMAQARMGAVESITPLQDFNDSIINILSTVQNVPENKIAPIATEIAKTAKLAQISAEDATKAFTTMNTAFNRPVNLQNIHKMAQEFFVLTKEAPGGKQAGQQLVTQLGQLASVTKLAGGTPEDIFSLALTGLRGGIPPAQLGRGLQFAIQTLALPGSQSKASRAALAQAGIRPGSTLNLQQRISRVYAHAKSLGLGKDTKKILSLDEDTLAQFGDSEISSGQLRQLGLSSRGAEYYGKAFPRIHALRAFASISNQLDVGQAQKDFKIMQDARDGQLSDVDDLAKAWKRFSDQAKLEAATVAISAMGQQVAQTFAPLLNWYAGHVVGASQFLSKHGRGTNAAVMGGVGLGAILGAKKFLGIGPGRLFKGATNIGAAESFLTGGGGKTVMTGLGNNPADPLYVYVVNSIFKPPIPTPGGGGGGGGGGTGPIITKGKFRIPGVPFGVGGPVAMAVAIPFTLGGDSRQPGYAGKGFGFGALNRYEHSFGKPGYGENEIFQRYRADKLSAAQADKMLAAQALLNRYSPGNPRAITSLFRTAFESIHGKAYVTMDVNLKNPDGTTTKRHLRFPMDLIGKTGMPPTATGGKNGRRN